MTNKNFHIVLAVILLIIWNLPIPVPIVMFGFENRCRSKGSNS